MKPDLLRGWNDRPCLAIPTACLFVKTKIKSSRVNKNIYVFLSFCLANPSAIISDLDFYYEYFIHTVPLRKNSAI